MLLFLSPITPIIAIINKTYTFVRNIYIMPALENEKHELFCNEYMIDCNGTRAYLRVYNPTGSPDGVGYDSARSSAALLLTKSSVSARIKELMDLRKDKVLVDSTFVVKGLIDVFQRCTKAQPVMVMGPDGRLTQKIDENGNGVWEFDSQAANKALELLGKHTGAFVDKISVQGNVEVNVTGIEIK